MHEASNPCWPLMEDLMKPKLTQKHAIYALSLMTAGAWAVLLAEHVIPDAKAVAPEGASRSLQQLDVERINIVDADGTVRLVIANQERFPDPVVRGKTIERSIRKTAGMVFYDDKGNEVGGLASSTGPKGHAMGALILDYGVQPTDGIGLMKSETPDGKSYMAGLIVSDRLPYVPGEIKTSEGVSRIWVGNQSQDASLELSDTEGNTRIRIAVGKDNVPRFDVLDAQGKVVKSLF